MNPAPRCIVFDLGKVLLNFSYARAARAIAAHSETGVATVRKLIDQSPLLLRFETGEMTAAEFLAAISTETKSRATPAGLTRCFANIFTPVAAMISIHAALRARGLPTYIFSNTNELAVAHIRAHYPFFSDFDGYIFSYEHRTMKPDARLYEVVERVTARKGAEIFYLDDKPENIAAGAARGWQTLLHETPEQTLEALAPLLSSSRSESAPQSG